jgi:hypothetical protein
MRTMKQLFAILILMLGSASAADYPITDLRAQIDEVLGKEWITSVSGNVIEITSTFDVFKVAMNARMDAPPDFNESVSQDVLAKEAKAERYVIRLEFSQPVSREEIQKRVIERQRFADSLTYGAHGKTEWSDACDGFLSIRVPKYANSGFCIYRVLPDHPNHRIYPPSAVAKIGGAKELLDVILTHIRHAYE